MGLIALLVGCTTTGSPPSAFEQKFFEVKTNFIPVTVIKTNIVPVTQWETNTVTATITNVTGVMEYRTNVTVIPVVLQQTNYSVVTNLQAAYEYTPNANANSIRDAGTGIGNLFGVGGLVGTAIGGIFGIWARMRSARSLATATSLAQNIEVMRQFIKQLPNGAQYDTAITSWIQNHQAQAGVLDQVLEILQKDVSNPDARFAAEQLHAALHQATGTPLNAPVA